MKHFFYAILAAVMPVIALSFASCNNDDDLPDVKIELNVENATIVDGTIYVVQGESFNVTGLSAINKEQGKAAALTNVRYFNNGVFIGQTIDAPFAISDITDAETPVGSYNLGVRCNVLAVDKSIAIGAFNYPYKVVASAEEIPGNGSQTMITNVSLSND